MKKEIDQKFKDVASYFKQRLIDGEYKFISLDKYHIEVSIDDYTFLVWTSNDQPKHLRFFTHADDCITNVLMEYMVMNRDEKRKAWRHLKLFIQEHQEEAKNKEIQMLKKQLKKLES